MNNKKIDYLIVFALICLLAIGYATLQSNLNIIGQAAVANAKWDIHFDNITITNGSIEINETAGDENATINPNDNTEVTYSVTLEKPGDYYEFLVDVKNFGTIDGMIETITSTLKINDEEPIVIADDNSNLPTYLDYIITYSDDVKIQPHHELKAGEKETYKVRLEFKTDIDPGDLPTVNKSLIFSFKPKYIQADESAIEVGPQPESFETDSWDVIAKAGNAAAKQTIVTNNKCGAYNVGDTKEVDMGSFGIHTVRIANCSTPIECSSVGFSQTACGLVIEFEDLTSTHNMNSTGTNVGGWPASDMRTYLNTDIYNALPSELQNIIIKTIVVSGHGLKSGETNFTSQDKLYLLSSKEVWGSTEASTLDTARDFSRQLDYYSTRNYSAAIKYNENNYKSWWYLRDAYSPNEADFNKVNSSGKIGARYYATDIRGVSPAFKVG